MGVNLRGMFPKELLKTIFNSVTKEHTLLMTEDYQDKVIFSKFMTLDNDGVTIDSAVDGSSVKKSFVVKPKPGEIMKIARLISSIIDGGSFDSGSYGNGLALTNGITAFFRIDGVDTFPAFDPQFPIKTNPDWAAACFDGRLDDYGQGDAQLVNRFTFTKFGKFMVLDGNKGDEFVIYINDDLTGLSRQLFLLQGYYEVGPLP